MTRANILVLFDVPALLVKEKQRAKTEGESTLPLATDAEEEKSWLAEFFVIDCNLNLIPKLS